MERDRENDFRLITMDWVSYALLGGRKYKNILTKVCKLSKI